MWNKAFRKGEALARNTLRKHLTEPQFDYIHQNARLHFSIFQCDATRRRVRSSSNVASDSAQRYSSSDKLNGQNTSSIEGLLNDAVLGCDTSDGGVSLRWFDSTNWLLDLGAILPLQGG